MQHSKAVRDNGHVRKEREKGEEMMGGPDEKEKQEEEQNSENFGFFLKKPSYVM